MNKSFFLENISLHTLSFPRFMAAPMDRIIDSPARMLIRQFSPNELLFGEMRHVACIAHGKADQSLKYEIIEQPLAFQVAANNTDSIDVAVAKILEHKFSMLNLNACCPSKNIIKSESGAYLMARPKLLKEILITLRKELQNQIPLTLKIRAGYKEKNGLDIAKLAQDCGVEMLIIHPRTQSQGFSAPLDFDLVKTIKETLSIPVIFSGEIHSFEDAKMTYEKTGVDGFMIGRALWGAPWKLHEITCTIENKSFHLSMKEIIELVLKHLQFYVKFYGPNYVLQMFKTHLSRYLKELPHANSLRRELMTINDYEEMKRKLEALL